MLDGCNLANTNSEALEIGPNSRLYLRMHHKCRVEPLTVKELVERAMAMALAMRGKTLPGRLNRTLCHNTALQSSSWGDKSPDRSPSLALTSPDTFLSSMALSIVHRSASPHKSIWTSIVPQKIQEPCRMISMMLRLTTKDMESTVPPQQEIYCQGYWNRMRFRRS